jgi:hypothetical protein
MHTTYYIHYFTRSRAPYPQVSITHKSIVLFITSIGSKGVFFVAAVAAAVSVLVSACTRDVLPMPI